MIWKKQPSPKPFRMAHCRIYLHGIAHAYATRWTPLVRSANTVVEVQVEVEVEVVPPFESLTHPRMQREQQQSDPALGFRAPASVVGRLVSPAGALPSFPLPLPLILLTVTTAATAT